MIGVEMARVEFCELEVATVKKSKSGWINVDLGTYKWQAYQTTPSGEKIIIYQSEPMICYLDEDLTPRNKTYALYHRNDESEKKYKQMLSALGNEGWEPEEYYSDVAITFKRKVDDSAHEETSENTKLLKQLASLRDAGILSDEEFQTKKAEILKRI